MNTSKQYKRIRLKRGYTNYFVTKQTGIRVSTLYMFESGQHSDMRVSTLIKLADVLDVSLDELVGRKR